MCYNFYCAGGTRTPAISHTNANRRTNEKKNNYCERNLLRRVQPRCAQIITPPWNKKVRVNIYKFMSDKSVTHKFMCLQLFFKNTEKIKKKG